MKKSLYSVIVFFLIIVPITSKAESKYLYDVLKEEAESGGVAKEYTGEHQDTVDNSGTDKIYYYNASSNEEADSIINKRNVIFAGYCWEIFRTTDSGGVKLLYSGIVSDGKCYGYNQSIGNYKYSLYENLDSIGSVGYMYNKLYPGYTYVVPTYGSYSVSGDRLTESEYNNVSISTRSNSSAFSYTSSGWKNANDSKGYAFDGTISFNLANSGNYALDYNFSNLSGRVEISINDLLLDTISVDKSGTLPLGIIEPSDTIKVNLKNVGSWSSTNLIFNIKKVTGTPVDSRAYFGNSVSYSNGMYTLVDTIRSDGTKNLANNHYFCKDGSISCADVYYTMDWYYPNSMQSFKLSNGMNIEEFVYDQLYADDVNEYDSALKSAIDNWYEHVLIDYTPYLEDTVFCQNRNFAYEDNGLNPNGGNPTGGSRKTNFYRSNSPNISAIEKQENFLYNSNLKCDNVTDRFSTSNEKAKLKYPVATINFAELLLLFNKEYDGNSFYGSKVRGHNNDYGYWLLSPYNHSVTYGWSVLRDGGVYYSHGSNNNSVRPVISLKKYTKYSVGDGSRENPYVVDLNFSVNVEVVNETRDLNVEIEDLTQVKYQDEVTFKVTPIKGFRLNSIKILDEDSNEINFSQTENEFTFTMPASDVTITPSYERVSSSVTVEDNENTEEIIIEVNDAEAVLYEDKVKIKVTPKNGYSLSKLEIRDLEGNLVEYQETDDGEYEFIMPDTDVTITPVYEIVVPDTGKDKDYTIYIVAVVLIVLGIVFIIVNNIKNKKK